MGTNYQGTTYQLMRELVILSINLNYIKETIQHNERYKANLMYLNISVGPLNVLLEDLIKRKTSLQRRFKALVEIQLVEKYNNIKDLLFVILPEQSGYRKKEMEQGWATIPDIYDNNWLINIRTGDLLEENYTNTKFLVTNIKILGSVYNYFSINTQDPLLRKDIRY